MSKTDQPEHRFSHWVFRMFDRIIIEPHYATAVDTGTYMHAASQAQRFAREEHRKFMGIKPHHLDVYIFGCQSRVYTQFELKYGDGKASSGQGDTITLLERLGIPTGVYWTLLEVYEHVRNAGFHLHGNAENIAHELELRWRAADEAARGPKVAKPRRTSRPRAQKPSPSAVARGHRMTVRPL